ncbi:MAG: hypothetical protein PHF46_01660 [Candidatus Gracilibacteria bacterium]|nr:hypothetical protein [Candidatus Gracilibacteria bacterium]MDD3120096.1 hypothetical protein [Candidatus Gracilibacteria bacterium]
MFCFILGKTPKLSIAEIHSLFPKIELVQASESFLIVKNLEENILREKFHQIGGTLKIIKIIKNIKDKGAFLRESVLYIQNKELDGKVNFGVSSYGNKINNFTTGLEIKKIYKKEGTSNLRMVNKDPENLNSAVIKKEKLDQNELELNFINTSQRCYFGITILSQDIDEYSRRDFEKFRDMNIGMLPPKLAQIMINLAGDGNVYDPFCGLGTVLIEALNSGIKNVYGSDISPEMVEKTRRNVETGLIFLQDASRIGETNKIKLNETGLNIVTEGYLGQVFSQRNISLDLIKEERLNLIKIYKGFFEGLQKASFKGNIVISFPFWEMRGTYIYFEEIYDLLKIKKIKIHKLLPEACEFKETKLGSLLYKRDNQTVGREIFKLSLN